MGTRVARRLVAGAVAGLAAGLLTVSGAGPAAAGGPTSVVLSLPGTGRMSVLHVNSADYEALADSVGANVATMGPAAEGAAGRHDQGPVLTLTWLIHDVQPWRVDYVYPTAPGGPWISTLQATDSGNVFAQTGVWHKPTDPVAFRALIARLGVDPTDWSPADGGTAPQGRPADSDPLGLTAGDSATPAATAAAAPAASSSGGWGSAGWVWGVVGLVAGAALTVAGEQAWARRRGRAADQAAGEAPSAGEPEPGPPAELELDPVVVRR
jgi:hypothetical protein